MSSAGKLTVAELRDMLNSLPPERAGETLCMWHPYFQRCFPIVAIDTLDVLVPGSDPQITLVTAQEP